MRLQWTSKILKVICCQKFFCWSKQVGQNCFGWKIFFKMYQQTIQCHNQFFISNIFFSRFYVKMSCHYCKENLGRSKRISDHAQAKLVTTSQELLPKIQTATHVSLTNGLPTSKGKILVSQFFLCFFWNRNIDPIIKKSNN